MSVIAVATQSTDVDDVSVASQVFVASVHHVLTKWSYKFNFL